MAFPPPLAGALAPPPRHLIESSTAEGGELGEAGGQSTSIVVISLLTEDETEYSHQGEQLLDHCRVLILRAIGSPDIYGGHPQPYQWPERGWNSEMEFMSNATNSVRSIGKLVLARNITAREARVIAHRVALARLSIPIRVTVYGPEADFTPSSDMPEFPVVDLGGSGLLDDMLSRLQRLVHGNSAPATDENFLRELPRSVVDAATLENLHVDGNGACALCMADFSLTEKITILPCKHYFHVKDEVCEGDQKSDTLTAASASDAIEGEGEGAGDADCEGILKWLRSNNSCPTCRAKLPAAPESANPGFGGRLAGGALGSASTTAEFAQPWVCVGCELENEGNVGTGRSATCTRCRSNRQATLVAHTIVQDQVLPRFLELYRDAEELRRVVVTTNGLSRQQLESSTASFLNGSGVALLSSAGWQIRSSLRSILTAPLSGDYEVSLAGIDSNSAALVRYLVRSAVARSPESELYCQNTPISWIRRAAGGPSAYPASDAVPTLEPVPSRSFAAGGPTPNSTSPPVSTPTVDLAPVVIDPNRRPIVRDLVVRSDRWSWGNQDGGTIHITKKLLIRVLSTDCCVGLLQVLVALVWCGKSMRDTFMWSGRTTMHQTTSQRIFVSSVAWKVCELEI